MQRGAQSSGGKQRCQIVQDTVSSKLIVIKNMNNYYNDEKKKWKFIYNASDNRDPKLG